MKVKVKKECKKTQRKVVIFKHDKHTVIKVTNEMKMTHISLE